MEAREAQRAKGVAGGLVRLATVGAAPGFIARGVAGDGQSHYAAGSDDQTLPWFYGLWRYLRSGIPTEADRASLVDVVQRGAEALDALQWRLPCDRPALGFRGSFTSADVIHASRLLFVLRALHQLTGERRWLDQYHRRREERPEGKAQTRLDLCARGITHQPPGVPARYWDNPPFWTAASSQACLRALAEMEEDAGIRAGYRSGLRATAERAAAHVERYRHFANDDPAAFDPDWRFLNALWSPQERIEDAVDVATRQVREWDRRSPRRRDEGEQMREPLFAAWVVALSGDRALMARHRESIRAALCHYRWPALYTSLFFAAECAYWEGLKHGL